MTKFDDLLALEKDIKAVNRKMQKAENKNSGRFQNITDDEHIEILARMATVRINEAIAHGYAEIEAPLFKSPRFALTDIGMEALSHVSACLATC